MKTSFSYFNFIMAASVILIFASCDKEDFAISPQVNVQTDADHNLTFAPDASHDFEVSGKVEFTVSIADSDAGNKENTIYILSANGEGLWRDHGVCKINIRVQVDEKTGEISGRVNYNFPDSREYFRWRLSGQLDMRSDAKVVDLNSVLVRAETKLIDADAVSGKGITSLFADLTTAMKNQAGFDAQISTQGKLN